MNAKGPLVSINIPTFNSERSLETCLSAVLSSTHKNLELIVVDSFSQDRTKEIAENFGAKVILTSWRLLGARYLGFRESKGSFILLLDSDQVLAPDAIEKAVTLFQSYDMLCLGERSYNPQNWVQKLFDADRIISHNLNEFHPIKGEVLPRFFKRWVLEKVFEGIPEDLLKTVVHFDHALIYYRAYKLTQKVELIPDAVQHMEMQSLSEIWRKSLRFGASLRELPRTPETRELLKRDGVLKRVRARLSPKVVFSSRVKYILPSLLLIFLKDVIFTRMGYLRG